MAFDRKDLCQVAACTGIVDLELGVGDAAGEVGLLMVILDEQTWAKLKRVMGWALKALEGAEVHEFVEAGWEEVLEERRATAGVDCDEVRQIDAVLEFLQRRSKET